MFGGGRGIAPYPARAKRVRLHTEYYIYTARGDDNSTSRQRGVNGCSYYGRQSVQVVTASSTHYRTATRFVCVVTT